MPPTKLSNEEVLVRVKSMVAMLESAAPPAENPDVVQRRKSVVATLEECQKEVCESLGGTWKEEAGSYGCEPPKEVNQVVWTLWYAAEIQVCNPLWGWVLSKPAGPKDPLSPQTHDETAPEKKAE